MLRRRLQLPHCVYTSIYTYILWGEPTISLFAFTSHVRFSRLYRDGDRIKPMMQAREERTHSGMRNFAGNEWMNASMACMTDTIVWTKMLIIYRFFPLALWRPCAIVRWIILELLRSWLHDGLLLWRSGVRTWTMSVYAGVETKTELRVVYWVINIIYYIWEDLVRVGRNKWLNDGFMLGTAVFHLVTRFV